MSVDRQRLTIAPGFHYEFEAGGLLSEDFVFVHPGQQYVRVYVVWQPDAECWLVHIKDRHEYVLLDIVTLSCLIRQVMQHKLPVWWWSDGSHYLGHIYPPTVTEDPDLAAQ